MISWLLRDYPEWQIVGEAADGLEGVQKAEELHPDLILLDVGLPKLNGIDAARSIRSIAPASKILFVSVDTCPEIARAALSTGAHGYVVKADAPDDLLPAMRAVLNGQRFVGSRFSGHDFSKSDD
jgi:DNA-binding NarL/FixJ family response regulator